MMKKIIAFLMMVGITVTSFVYATQPAVAANDWNSGNVCGSDMDDELKEAMGCSNNKTAPSAIEILIKGVISVLGVVAVVIIVVGGQRFIVSQGDASKITAARGMIIYGVVGLVIALLAFAIVSFITGAIGS